MSHTEAMAGDPQVQGWGTWEELLLACAVKRHGFQNWDFVALEIQSRSSLPRTQTTAQNCQKKYHDLNLRFASPPPYSLAINEQIRPQAATAAVEEETVNIPWLDDLRKLRVAELKQEVHRYDASILSLQLKVKRLEEERGKSMEAREEDQATATTDLKQHGSETDGNKETSLSASVSDEEADRDSRSVHELSNSNGSKGESTAGMKDEAGVKLLDGGEDWSERDPVPACPNSQEPPSSLGTEGKREEGARDHNDGVLPENMKFVNVRSKEKGTPVTIRRSLRRINTSLSKDSSSPSKRQTRRSHRLKVGSAEKNSPVVRKSRRGDGSAELKRYSTRGRGRDSVTLKKNNSRGSSVTRKKNNIRGGSNHRIVESKKKRMPRKNCEKKQVKGRNNQPKNSVGRPSKKEAKVSKVSGKHGRDGDEKDVAKRPRTRPRR